MACLAHIDPMLTIAPPLRSATMDLATACAMKNDVRSQAVHGPERNQLSDRGLDLVVSMPDDDRPPSLFKDDAGNGLPHAARTAHNDDLLIGESRALKAPS